MNFLNWLGRNKMAKDSADILEFTRPTLAPVYEQEPVYEPAQEHYRVGFNTHGMTTLTLMTDGGATTTLSMTPHACEQLIRMLRASYQPEDEPDIDPEDPDGGEPVPVPAQKAA